MMRMLSLCDILIFLQDVLSFRQSMVRRVEEILQLKELQEKIKETETQLKLAKHDNWAFRIEINAKCSFNTEW